MHVHVLLKEGGMDNIFLILQSCWQKSYFLNEKRGSNQKEGNGLNGWSGKEGLQGENAWGKEMGLGAKMGMALNI